MESPEGGYS